MSIAYDRKHDAACALRATGRCRRGDNLAGVALEAFGTRIFKPFLSIGDAIRILIMICNNPATSGLDMSPELLVRMLETIDNLTMVKGCTGDLSRMQRVDTSSAAAGCLSTTALIR